MNFAVIITPSAERGLKKLPRKEVETIARRIDTLAANPHPAGSKKLKGTRDEYRIRSGKYRMLYRIDEKSKRIFVHAIGHRKDVYG